MHLFCLHLFRLFYLEDVYSLVLPVRQKEGICALRSHVSKLFLNFFLEEQRRSILLIELILSESGRQISSLPVTSVHSSDSLSLSCLKPGSKWLTWT